ncbi:hypothetical protein [Sphingomonas crocodyli]|uniref:Extradiol ring-cleavage dioxygenase LigAB LigA subunit domain-containing protein n=1 Tax=Sphingomonas crocodyli TaxID=1979270 RepID=A0A437M5H1_9SPHN|nr:hypothetical protein [Sphingomonas crocodyli]RVT92938.1 hypothetical protein EOD43_03255 [Sphingomonas crocodyli]
MIQDLLRDAAAAEQFSIDPAPVFERYAVTSGEAAMLEAGTIEAMTDLGVHPNLQMKYLRLRKGKATAQAGPLDVYLDRLLER